MLGLNIQFMGSTLVLSASLIARKSENGYKCQLR